VDSYLLFNLQTIDQRRQLRVNLKSLLVELKLSLHEVGEVPKRLGSIQHVLHDTDGLLSAANEFVFGRFNLGTLGLGEVVFIRVLLPASRADSRKPKSTVLGTRLGSIECQTSVLDTLAGLLRECNVGVECGRERGVEARHDLGILLQTRLTDLLGGERILLKRGGEGIVGFEEMRRCERGSAKGVVEGLGRGLGAGLREGRLGFGGGRGGG